MKSIAAVSRAVMTCVLLGVMVGCGAGNGAAGNGTPPVSPATVNDLRGGWVITGGLPTLALPGTVPTSLQLGLTLDVIAGQVSGTGDILVPCSPGPVFNGAVGGGMRVEVSSVAADGTFTLQDVLVGSSTAHQFVIQGKLPDVAGGLWTGSYMAGAPNSSCNGVVPPSSSGVFTAARIQPVTGTFVSTGTFNSSTAPVTLTANLMQGGPASLNVPGAEVTGVNALEGTIQVQGSPCFTSGTIQNNHGAVLGTHVQLEFTMNDGSKLLVSSEIDNTAATELGSENVLVSGGVCDKAFGFLQAKFTKQ